MPRSFMPSQKKLSSASFDLFYQPVVRIFPQTPVLASRGDRPLQMTFEDQLKALIFYHLEEHLIARSQYGLMVQILAGLITYLLLAIHCHEKHGENVSIKRVRELRLQIQNELRESEPLLNHQITKEQKYQQLTAKT